jgi:hypothetical protein
MCAKKINSIAFEKKKKFEEKVDANVYVYMYETPLHMDRSRNSSG